jgi:NTE family protein
MIKNLDCDVMACQESDTVRERAYIALEGGGAKGIVHVGALRIIEELKLDVRGYAGTSAGAVVAAFADAGYTSREIMNPDNQQTILDDLNISRPTDLFGPGGWSEISVLKDIMPMKKLISISTLLF